MLKTAGIRKKLQIWVNIMNVFGNSAITSRQDES